MSEKASQNGRENKSETAEINRRNYLKMASAAGASLGAGVTASALGSEITTPAQAATTIEDFEDGSTALDDYSGNTSMYSIQSSTSLEGSYTLKGDGLYGEIGHDNVATPRGYEYRYRMQAGSSGAKPCMLLCVQDSTSPQDDCYQVFPDPSSSNIEVHLRKNNSWQKDVISESFSFSTGTEYQIGVKLKSGSIQVVIYDSSGSTLHTTSEVSESTWSGGNLGFYIGGETPGYFDEVRKIDLGGDDGGGGSSTGTYNKSNIDPFEFTDEEFNAYRFDRGKSGAEIITDTESTGTQVHGPTYSGQQALKISNSTTEMVSLPGDGLPNYPQAGDSIKCYVKASGGADNFNLKWGAQDHDNHYYVKVKPESDRMFLFKYKNGSGTVLDSTSGLSMSQDTWYWLEVEWQTNGGQTVELYDLEDNTLAECNASDSEWSTGGIGYSAYLDSGQAVYFDECVIVEEEGPHVGGWGPVAVPSIGHCCPSATTEDGTWYDKNDFRFYLDYAGYTPTPDTIQHDFQVSGTFHTYEVLAPFSANPSPDRLRSNGRQYDTKVRAEGPSHASITSADDAYTWAFGLGGTQWENWKNNEDNYVGTTPSLDDFKARAEEEGVFGEAVNVDDWVIEGLKFAASVIVGDLDEVGGFILEASLLLGDFATDPEPNCQYNADNDVSDLELSEWFWCNPPVSLVMMSRSLRVEVPRGSGDATVQVKQLVGSEQDPEENFLTENLCKWDITCPDEEINASWSATTEYGDF